MNCALALASVCAICAASTSAYGAEPEITSVEAGDLVPFSGDLFPPEASIRWALELETCAERAEAELAHARDKHAVELRRAGQIAEITARADARRVEALTAELEALNVWYRSPVFVATVAATVAVSVLLASTVLVQATGEVGR